MKFSEARQGRTFVIRLEDGEILHEQIERFARAQSIQSAALVVVGAADAGSRMSVGPENGRTSPVRPIVHALPDVHEVAGVGTLFADEDGSPRVHVHFAAGRRTRAVAGCAAGGVKVWQVMEVILFELTGCSGRRLPDPETGFNLLIP